MTLSDALTVDVEEYFHASTLEAVCGPPWEGYASRVEGNTRQVLALLEEAGARATFFVLGWVAERFPDLVRELAARGHEVASHGDAHRPVGSQTREEFREDARRSKALLEDLTGGRVLGYRAPGRSLSRSTLWAFDELVDAGYTYDSSVHPLGLGVGSLSEWPRFPFRVERLEGGNWVPAEEEPGRPDGASGAAFAWAGGPAGPPSRTPTPPDLLEVPITPLRLGGVNLPVAGGSAFRLLPYAFTLLALGRIHLADGKPCVFRLRTWELDPDQPRLAGAGLGHRFRHYVNLDRCEPRLRQLLTDFRFAPVAEVFGLG